MLQIQTNNDQNSFNFGEVQFFFFSESPADPSVLHPYALVVLYSAPDNTLLEDSFQTLYACKHLGQEGLRVIPVNQIISVVAMQPFPYDHMKEPQYEDFWFVGEKLGLDDAQIGAPSEPLDRQQDRQSGVDGNGPTL